MTSAPTTDSRTDTRSVDALAPAARPLRVAHVLHAFSVGGAERIAALLANHTDRAGFQPMIICLDRNRAGRSWHLADDVPIVELRKRSGNDPRVVFRMAKVLREHQVDVVHSNNWGTLLETSLARRLAGVPRHVHVEHGAELVDLNLGFLKRRLRGTAMRWGLGRVDAVVSVCQGVTERIVERCGYPAERVRQIPNGVDCPEGALDAAERNRVRAELGIGPETCLIGSVGRLAPVKDFGTAIEAVARLIADGRDVHLLLVGDGPEQPRLADLAEARGIADRVHLVGQQCRVGPWLSAIDVYINSSLSEGMSLSILEAMSAGLPSVVTAVGESASLVAGGDECGVLVEPGAPEPLTAALGRLVNDASLRTRLGDNARKEFSRRYMTGQMVRQYEHLYHRLVFGHGSRHQELPYG